MAENYRRALEGLLETLTEKERFQRSSISQIFGDNIMDKARRVPLTVEQMRGLEDRLARDGYRRPQIEFAQLPMAS